MVTVKQEKTLEKTVENGENR